MKTETLCSNLWSHAVVDLSNKRFRACCKTKSIEVTDEEIKNLGQDVFLNHPTLVMARKEMMDGQKTERCQVCWDMEKIGPFSYRDRFVGWRKFMQPNMYQIEDFTRSDYPDNLDIQLDNYCDLKCIYCTEEFSSQWLSEKLKYGDYVQPNLKSMADPELEDIFFAWFHKIKMHLTKRIAFLGGEPLISPVFYTYFERILNCYNGNFPPYLEFNIITNLNTSPIYMEKFVHLLNTHCDKVKFNINISMEAWGSRAELIRANVNFERFKNNWETLASLDKRIMLSTITSVNVLSVSSLSDYLKFLLDLEVKHDREIIFYPNLISEPQWLNVSLVPSEFYSRYIQECIEMVRPHPRHKIYFDFLHTLETKFKFEDHKGSELHMQFIREIDKIAVRRNVSYQKIFEEYAYIWDANLEP